MMLDNIVKPILVQSTFLLDTIYSSIIVNIIDVCNYNCFYCYNTKPRTGLLLDLKKLYTYIEWYFNNINKNINLYILGGEPTLHPDLYDFCKKLTDNKLISSITITTNLSMSLQLINKFLEIGIKIIATWHSLPTDSINSDYISKIKNIDSKYYRSLQLRLNIMFELQYSNIALDIFDFIYTNITKHLDFSLIDNNHLHGKQDKIYEYSDELLYEFNKRITNTEYFENLKSVFVIYKYNNYEKNYILALLLQDSSLTNFHNYKCMAGLYQVSIYFNGDISPCDDLFEKNIIIGNIYESQHDIKKYKYRICQLHNCPCPVFSKKENVFK